MLYTGTKIDYAKGTFEEQEGQLKANYAQLKACDEAARAKGTMVGRTVKHGFADGYAYYQIVKENKKTYTIVVCRGLGDDWVLPAWGERATVGKRQIDSLLGLEDALRELFAKGREKWKAA